MILANKGNYYKNKTAKYFRDLGYAVETSEKYIRYLDKKTNSVKWYKKDIFGADLIAINREEIIFIQVKFGRKNIAQAIKEFAKYPFPPFVKLWVVVWEKGAREPEIINYWEVVNEQS